MTTPPESTIPAAFSISKLKERAMGLEPTTSSLGSREVTTRLRYTRYIQGLFVASRAHGKRRIASCAFCVGTRGPRAVIAVDGLKSVAADRRA